jgi:DNA repair protein RadC
MSPVLDLELEAISDAELVSRLLAAHAREARIATLDVAAMLLSRCGGLHDLRNVGAAEIAERLTAARVPHAASAARAIEASFEIARRIGVAEREPPMQLVGSADVAEWAMPRLGSLTHEELWLLALDGRGRMRGARCVARGGLHGAAVRAADPLRYALRASASGFVLVHNHPSGDATPSAHDVLFTREVAAAAAVVGVPLLDHVVVTKDAFSPVPFEGGAA